MLFFQEIDALAIPDEARFELIADIGFAGSRFYLYSPSRPHLDAVMSRMRNAVVFVYPDTPCETREKALQTLSRTGLLDLSEREAAYVIVPLPVAGNTWGEADVTLYREAQYYLAGGDVYEYPDMQYERFVFNNLQYIVAEGRGATFVNNILSRHAQRIAGILTFGGTMKARPERGPAVPAYLVAADPAAVSYYRAVNAADDEIAPGVFENSGHRLKKVVSIPGGRRFDEDIMADAWRRIFSRTARVCITDNVVLDNRVASEWILMERPDYGRLGITRVAHIQEPLPDQTVATWYDLVPDRIAADPNVRVPLVITLHGKGGDPIYEADSNGWTAKAAEKGFVVISPVYPGPTPEGERMVLGLLDYALKTYPIDEKRVYLAGFSMGGAAAAMIGLKHGERFAAIAPMGATGYRDDATADIVRAARGRRDLPFVMIIGTEDCPNVTRDAAGNKCVTGGEPFKGGLELLLEMNNIDRIQPDYARHPYWGCPTHHPEILTSKNLKYHVSYLHQEGAARAVAKLVLFENAGHAHSDYLATLAWDFFSEFSCG